MVYILEAAYGHGHISRVAFNSKERAQEELEALKAKEAVPGATLSNGGQTISITSR